MTQILVFGANILGVDPTPGDTHIAAGGMLWPKSVIPGWQIVDAELPAGFACDTHEWNGAAVVPRAPTQAEVERERAEIIAAADQIAKNKRDAVVIAISSAEMASWPIKRAEALAYQSSGNAAEAPSLAMEAQARGITLAALADKVLAKAGMLSALEAAIAGRCGAIQDAAAAATSVAELDAIDLDAGWPV